MHLSDQLRALALGVADVELKLEARSAILDVMMDLHNDLNEWAVNTEHDAAAQEVMTILDQFLDAASRVGMPTPNLRLTSE